MRKLLGGVISILITINCYAIPGDRGTYSQRLPDPMLYLESMAKGFHPFLFDDEYVRIHGKVSVEEMEFLTSSLCHLPHEAIKYGNEIFISEEIGSYVLEGKPVSFVMGKSYGGRIMLERSILVELHTTQDVLYHEIGHNFDVAKEYLSKSKPWGSPPFLSPYSQKSPQEDLAEIYSDVMIHREDYTKRNDSDWNKDPLGEKKRKILEYYLPL